MISRDSMPTVIGGIAYTTGGEKLGSIGQIYLDNATGDPAWITVKTGLLGTDESFVPLTNAETTADGVRLPYDLELVKGAPHIQADRALSPGEESELFAYYSLAAFAQVEAQSPGEEQDHLRTS